MNGDCFYMRKYAHFGSAGKATSRSPSPDKLTRRFITQSKSFTRKGIGKVNRSGQAYFYLVLSSQVQTRLSIASYSASPADAQQVFKTRFNAPIKEDYSFNVDIDRYESVLEHALSKEEFLIGTGFYMVPSNLNLSDGKCAGCNNRILIGNADMKIDSSRNINKAEVYHQKSTQF